MKIAHYTLLVIQVAIEFFLILDFIAEIDLKTDSNLQSAIVLHFCIIAGFIFLHLLIYTLAQGIKQIKFRQLSK